MKLLAFRVREFRSIDDSEWIETDQVTALIGTNEAGKTNVLVPLWELKPAKDGAIEPLADYPRKRYHEMRALNRKPKFIEARFSLPEGLRLAVAKLLKVSVNQAEEAIVGRDFDGVYSVDFPGAGAQPTLAKKTLLEHVEAARADIEAANIVDGEEPLREGIYAALNSAIALLTGGDSEVLGAKARDKIRE